MAKLDWPAVVFGTTPLGNLFQDPGDAAKREIVRQWLEHAGRPVWIDTAGKYGAGLANEVLSRELTAAGVAPGDVVISDKLGWRRVPLRGSKPTFEPDAWVGIEHDAVQDISGEGILRCYEQDCELLGDYAPRLLSVHDPDEYLAAAADAADRRRRLDDILGAYESLFELKRAGRADAIGVGCKDWRVVQELDRRVPLDWVMIANSYTVMRHPPELAEFLDELAARCIPVINSALLHGGFLAGSDFCDYRRLDPAAPADREKLRWREAFWQVCREQGVDPFFVAVAFGRSHPAVKSVALASHKSEHVGGMTAAAGYNPPHSLWRSLADAGLIEASAAERALSAS